MAVGFDGVMPSRWESVTPSDSTDLTGSICLFIGGDGNVAARTLNNADATVTFSGLSAGAYVPGNFTRVMAATTATSILVAYP